MKTRWLVAGLVALMMAGIAQAGTGCEKVAPQPRKIAAAADMALRVAAELDRVNAPVALVARHGTDLSKYGLFYSHVGFALRDSADGRWTVIHLLNDCGSERSGLHAQGLVDFFADNLIDVDARIVWLKPEMAQPLADHLLGSPERLLHQPRYNLIARPGSARYQNSTAWALENLMAGVNTACIASRADAHACAGRDGFRDDHIHIRYGQRIVGGMFSANTVFTDHPVATT